jgi:alpha-methylacyl-CoA racemase
MILADFGADVVRVDRVGGGSMDHLARGKRSVAVNLKTPEGVETVLRLASRADVLLEPYRPGVMERLGLGPEIACARNPRLIYARLTGFGQDGPYANMAGHDINYIAISGALSLLGRKGEKPLAPVNLVGDFAGGGMLCALGITLALIERSQSGKGQVVDAAMVDGAAYLMALTYAMHAQGTWRDERGVNVLDSGAPWYDTYETSDGKWLAVGAIEKRFYAEFIERLGLSAAELPPQHDRSGWPELRRRFAAAIKQRTRDDWERIFEGSDACVAPVLALGEVGRHPHNAARATFIERDGVMQPAPAPRFSRTPAEMGAPPRLRGADSASILRDWGFAGDEIESWTSAGIVGTAK